MSIQFLDAHELANRLPPKQLIEGLARSFATTATAPLRQNISGPDGREFLLMPVTNAHHAGAKLLTITPDNAQRGLPAIQGLFALFDLRTGEPLGVMDAAELTSRRTAAVSALAADRLARRDAQKLLLIGSGNLVPYFAEAMLAVRDFQTIAIWARDPAKAEAARDRTISHTGHERVEILANLRPAVQSADVISCLTGATEPLVQGAWLEPGTHLDLVGGYRPDMREADDEAVAKALVYVDDRDAVLAEAGDLVQPLENGTITQAAILGDISDIANGAGRANDRDITLFKTVGTAAADLIAASLAIRGTNSSRTSP